MAKTRKIRGTPEDVADIFTRNSIRVTRREFSELLDYALQDYTSEEIDAIAEHMPPKLRGLLPRKYLH